MKPIHLDKLNELQLAAGIAARVVTAESMSVAFVQIAAGSLLPEHHHPNEQVVCVIEGELELTVDGEPHILVPGRVMVLPPNLPHSGRAITDCRVIDVFHPVREDFRRSASGGSEDRD